MTSQRLNAFVPGAIWLAEYPIRYAGTRFNARMTVIRLDDGRVLIHSPCELDDALAEDVEALGPVSFIVAPSNFHYFYVTSCQQAFPDARTSICPGVDKKKPDLRFDDILTDAPDPEWSSDLDQVLVDSAWLMREAVFFHKSSHTLIVVDLIENIGDETPGVNWTLKLWWKTLFRMWNRAKPAPEYQMGWGDKVKIRHSLERILDWDFDKVVLAHGDLITTDAKETVRQAWRRPLRHK